MEEGEGVAEIAQPVWEQHNSFENFKLFVQKKIDLFRIVQKTVTSIVCKVVSFCITNLKR